MLSECKVLPKNLGLLILLHLEFPLQNANGGANAQEWRVKGQTAGFSLITVIIAQRTRFVNVFLQKMQLFPRQHGARSFHIARLQAGADAGR